MTVSAMSKKQTSISIVMPFLDAKEEIKDLFTCLQKQINIDKNNIEIVIVDDGSTDDTVQEIKKYSHLLDDYESLNIVRHKRRQGHTTTRIDGAKVARGKYLAFIDKKGRPDSDYIYSFINKNRNIIIGNPYVDKNRSVWGRVLSLVRIKLYYPYFNHPFEDISLDHDQYLKFKNKGGGGSMFVLRKYYLEVAKTMPTSIHVSDDNLYILKLAEIEPILKTSSPKIEYLNRTGFKENIIHLYNRGPKFVDFYAKPGTRYFIPIIVLVCFVVIDIIFALLLPIALILEFIVLLVLLIGIALYLSEDFKDIISVLFIMPIAIVCFSLGVLRGLLLKLLNKY